MPVTNLTQTIDNPGEEPASVKGNRPDDPAVGVNQGQFFFEASRNAFDLTPLEKQVIALTVAGYSHEERANTIGISKPALRQQLAQIRDKLGVACECELVLFVIYYHLIDTYEVSPPSDELAAKRECAPPGPSKECC